MCGLVSISEGKFSIVELSPEKFEELSGLVRGVPSACGDMCRCGVEACAVFGGL
jgi:hypothetical protein